MNQQATDGGHWALLQRAMDALEREAELLEALEGLCEIARAWEVLDGRKNIQLEHSQAYQSALAAIARATGNREARAA